MNFRMNVLRDEPLEEGSYQAVLKSIEKKVTAMYGERLMWLFSIPDHNAEVPGWTSLSESTMAKAYQFAVVLNPELATMSSWSSEDVVGCRCTVVVEVYEDDRGRKKNKVVRVKPPQEAQTG